MNLNLRSSHKTISPSLHPPQRPVPFHSASPSSPSLLTIRLGEAGSPGLNTHNLAPLRREGGGLAGTHSLKHRGLRCCFKSSDCSNSPAGEEEDNRVGTKGLRGERVDGWVYLPGHLEGSSPRVIFSPQGRYYRSHTHTQNTHRSVLQEQRQVVPQWATSILQYKLMEQPELNT